MLKQKHGNFRRFMLTCRRAFRDAFNSLTEGVQGATSAASKEGNKNVAKDSNAKLSTRAQAAGDAVKDKLNQETHERKSDAYSEASKHR